MSPDTEQKEVNSYLILIDRYRKVHLDRVKIESNFSGEFV